LDSETILESNLETQRKQGKDRKEKPKNTPWCLEKRPEKKELYPNRKIYHE